MRINSHEKLLNLLLGLWKLQTGKLRESENATQKWTDVYQRVRCGPCSMCAHTSLCPCSFINSTDGPATRSYEKPFVTLMHNGKERAITCVPSGRYLLRGVYSNRYERKEGGGKVAVVTSLINLPSTSSLHWAITSFPLLSLFGEQCFTGLFSAELFPLKNKNAGQKKLSHYSPFLREKIQVTERKINGPQFSTLEMRKDI